MPIFSAISTTRYRSASSTHSLYLDKLVSGRQAAALSDQSVILGIGLRSVGLKRRIGGRTVDGLTRSDRISVRLAPPLRHVDAVDPRPIETEHLLLEHWRELRVAMRLSQHRVNLEAAEGLDLVLRGTIPNRVGAPENIFLADVL